MAGSFDNRNGAPDLILATDAVVTLWPGLPKAEAVAARDGLIVAVGSRRDILALAGSRTEVIDRQGGCVVPGFYDAHIHLPACAKKRIDADCSPPAVTSIKGIRTRIRERACSIPQGDWIEARNYDEFRLAERRHPTRWDLDEAAPNHPVRLRHRSLHASVLNSIAMRLVGIRPGASAPPGAGIEVDPETHEPTGLIYEDGQMPSGGFMPPHDESALRPALRQVLTELLANGITSVNDASFSNGLREWHRLRDICTGENFQPRVRFMVGQPHLMQFLEEGIGPGSGDEWLSVGAVKLMLTEAAAHFHPTPQALQEQIRQACRHGYSVAIHAVEESTICVAIESLAEAASWGPRPLHRIEHCCVLPPPLLDRLAEVGATVVTHPGFVLHNGDRYLAEVESHLQGWLYPVRSLLDAGTRVGAGSDAPLSPAKPLDGVSAAVTRRTSGGYFLAQCERISAEEALRIHTIGAADVCGEADRKGSIEPGKLADVVVLSADPISVKPCEIGSIQVEMTVVGGRVAWQKC